MRTLTSAERRTLRAKAHHLQPVVSIGNNGLTASVLHEIDVNLTAHELVKVRVFDAERDERARLLEQLCADLDAAAVQHLGKTLTLWRPSPAPEPAPTTKSRTARAKTSAGSGARRGARAERQRGPAVNSRRRRRQA